MSTVINTSSPIEVIDGKRVYSELTPMGNVFVGRIDAFLQDHKGQSFTPSQIARKIGALTHEAQHVLAHLDARQMFVVGDGNGSWRRYAAR